MKAICKKHGEYESDTIQILGLKFQTECPLCQEERAKYQREEHQKFLEETKNADLLKRGVDPEFFEATLGNYKAETESEQRALTACKQMVEGNVKKLLLLGNNGTGKTHLANALVKAFDGVRITMYELSAKIRAGYNEQKSELEVLDGLLRYPLIAIDELGRTKGSDAEFNWLSYLIDKAHTRGIRLVLVSNKLQAHSLPADKKQNAIELYLPNDVISRLRQESIIVEVIGRDRRAGRTAPIAV